MMPESFHSGISTSELQTGEVAVDPITATIPPARPLPWHVRFGLSWSAGAVPVVLILLLGAALGPEGLAVLTPGVLVVIEPVLPVALAALGVLAGLEFTQSAAPHGWSLLGKASIESMFTCAVVAFGVWLVIPVFPDVASSDVWLVALMAGLCASMSATLPDAEPDRLRPPLVRMRNLDALAPVALGAVVLAFMHSPSVLAALGLIIQTTILAFLISATAWLLLSDSSPSTEQRVFSIAALLLIAGIADYLSISALACGLLAGLFWGSVAGVARDCIERDVRYLRHPLIVLMLLAAGAKTTFSVWILVFAAAYLLLRLAGKLLGGWFARRAPGVFIPDGVGPTLLPPGVFGIAFALDATAMMESAAALILAATVLGSIGSQLLAALWHPAGTHE